MALGRRGTPTKTENQILPCGVVDDETVWGTTSIYIQPQASKLSRNAPMTEG